MRYRAEIAGVLKETAGLALIGIALGLAANQLSPRGLSLTRNYFPQTLTPASNPKIDSAIAAATDTVAMRLEREGLETIAFAELRELFKHQDQSPEALVLVDARRADQFQQGHIPGAYSFDRYQKAPDATELLGACAIARKIIVYCNGGSCEDSEFAALDLKQMGVPAERLRVYTGGITEWKGKGMPVERQERASGLLSP